MSANRYTRTDCTSSVVGREELVTGTIDPKGSRPTAAPKDMYISCEKMGGGGEGREMPCGCPSYRYTATEWLLL